MGLDGFPQPVMGANREVSDHAAATTEEPMRITPGSLRYGSEVMVDGFSSPGWDQRVRLGRVTNGEGYTDDVKLTPRSSGDGAASGGIFGGIGRAIGNFFKTIGRGFLSWFGIETGSQPHIVSSRTVGLVDPGEVSTGGGIVVDAPSGRAVNPHVANERIRVFHTGAFNIPVIVRSRVQIAQPAVTAVRPRVFCGIP